MTRAYTPAEESWLREHYHAGPINDTLDAFEREFGSVEVIPELPDEPEVLANNVLVARVRQEET